MKFNWEALCRMDWILDFTDRNIHLYIENGHSTAPARNKASRTPGNYQKGSSWHST